MRDERVFLQALLADPTDDSLRLVYADWLEEQNEPGATARAEFLRRTVELAAKPVSSRRQMEQDKRLQQLAADLDTDWLAVVSRLPLENCQKKRQESERRRAYPIRFDFLCDRRWENLQATDNHAVRYCESCRQNVHYCDTIMEARKHARNGHCIAVDLGVIRRKGDLAPEILVMGRVSPEMMQEEDERLQPDAVSAERERRKRKQSATSDHVQRVRVRDGTFAGMEGVVTEALENKGAVRVELTIFGRPVPVELECWQVEEIAD